MSAGIKWAVWLSLTIGICLAMPVAFAQDSFGAPPRQSGSRQPMPTQQPMPAKPTQSAPPSRLPEMTMPAGIASGEAQDFGVAPTRQLRPSQQPARANADLDSRRQGDRHAAIERRCCSAAKTRSCSCTPTVRPSTCPARSKQARRRRVAVSTTRCSASSASTCARQVAGIPRARWWCIARGHSAGGRTTLPCVQSTWGSAMSIGIAAGLKPGDRLACRCRTHRDNPCRHRARHDRHVSRQRQQW